MMEKLHPVQLEEELHSLLKQYSKKSGIKIKYIVESAIISYLNKMKFQDEEQNG
jgi:hypothetical protein